MAPHPAAGLQDMYARMFVRQFDQFPDVDPRFGADQRKFVGKGNLNVTRRIFGQLTHLGRPGIGRMQRALHETGVKSYRPLRRSLVDPADHPVVVHQLVQHVARQHPLRTVGDVQLPFELGPLRKDQPRHPVGRSDRRSGFDDKKVARFQQRNDRTRSGLHVRNVRLVIPFERSRHDDQVNAARDRLRSGPEPSRPHDFADYLPQSRFDNVNLAPVDGIHDLRIDIDSDDLQSFGCGHGRRRQADIAQPEKKYLFGTLHNCSDAFRYDRSLRRFLRRTIGAIKLRKFTNFYAIAPF